MQIGDRREWVAAHLWQNLDCASMERDEFDQVVKDALDEFFPAAADGVSPPQPQDDDIDELKSPEPTRYPITAHITEVKKGQPSASGPLPPPPQDALAILVERHESLLTEAEASGSKSRAHNLRARATGISEAIRLLRASGPLPERGPTDAKRIEVAVATATEGLKWGWSARRLALNLLAEADAVSRRDSWGRCRECGADLDQLRRLEAAESRLAERGDAAEQLAEATRELLDACDECIDPEGHIWHLMNPDVETARAALAAFSAPRTPEGATGDES